jgi:hypothetical protein
LLHGLGERAYQGRDSRQYFAAGPIRCSAQYGVPQIAPQTLCCIRHAFEPFLFDDHLPPYFTGQRLQHVLIRHEVVVKRPPGKSRSLADILYCHSVDAMRIEKIEGSRQYLRARPNAPRLSRSRSEIHRCQFSHVSPAYALIAINALTTAS